VLDPSMESIEGLDLILSILISGIGFVLFSYGRKMSRAPQLAGGLILMIFPYFINSILGMLVTATLLLLAIWGAIKLGW